MTKLGCWLGRRECSSRDHKDPVHERKLRASSFRVVENDSQRIPMAGSYAAYTMAQVDTVWPAGSLNRSVTDRENHSVTLLQSDDLGAGLHPRPLFRQHKLSAGEVLAWT
jgi:hypothetical protein